MFLGCGVVKTISSHSNHWFYRWNLLIRNGYKKHIKNKITNWNILRKKQRHECNVIELKRLAEHSKHMIYTFLISTIIIMGIVIELYTMENMVSITFNTLLIVCLVALYDERQNRYNLQMFIYMKNKDQIEKRIKEMITEVESNDLLLKKN